MKQYTTLTLLLMFVTAFTLHSCTNHGKKEESGHVEVYYKDKANKELAKKLADLIRETDVQVGNKLTRKSFQLLGGPNEYSIKMVALKAKLKDMPPGTFNAMAVQISEKIFDGKPVDIELTNDRFKTFETIKYRKIDLDSLEKAQ